MRAPVYIGLIHAQVYNKNGEVVTTAITNYDLHDIARSAKTYAVQKYFIIHPIDKQCELAKEVMQHWQEGFGSTYNPDRKEAFTGVQVVKNLEDAINVIETDCGQSPCIVTTDARTYENTVSYANLRREINSSKRPLLLLFGTGYGIKKEVMNDFDYILEPIYGSSEYNHLCVRAAAAIILDRLLGEEWWHEK